MATPYPHYTTIFVAEITKIPDFDVETIKKHVENHPFVNDFRPPWVFHKRSSLSGSTGRWPTAPPVARSVRRGLRWFGAGFLGAIFMMVTVGFPPVNVYITWKITVLMGKSSNDQFSIAMLVYQRVTYFKPVFFRYFLCLELTSVFSYFYHPHID